MFVNGLLGDKSLSTAQICIGRVHSVDELGVCVFVSGSGTYEAVQTPEDVPFCCFCC